jgi:hypothetical protein
LARAGVAHRTGDVWSVDVWGFVQLVARRTPWRELGVTNAPLASMVVAESSSVDRSPAAALYALLAAAAARRGMPPARVVDVDAVVNDVSPLFVNQATPDRGWDAPLVDLLGGITRSPLAVVDESQVVAAAAARRLPPEAVLMYPRPAVVSEYGFVPLRGVSAAVGRIVASDPELTHLAMTHGFRTADAGAFMAFARQHGVNTAARLGTVVRVPSYDALAALVARLTIAEHLTVQP